MGGPRETLELLQNGALDMTKASASEMEPFSPAFSIFSLPYLFKDQAHFNKVIYGPVGESMMAQTRDKGFVSIAAYVAGTRSFYANKPIHTPADMKGMKIGWSPPPHHHQADRTAGCGPGPDPFGEVYTALQQGVIDGAENNEPSYVQTRHVEVAKFYAEDQHTSVPDFLVISSKVLDKLSDEQKAILTTAAKHSETYEQELWDKEVAASRKQATDAGPPSSRSTRRLSALRWPPGYDDFRKDPIRGGGSPRSRMKPVSNHEGRATDRPPGRTAMRLEKFKQPIDRLLAGFTVAVMAMLVVCVVWQVFSRYVLAQPSTMTDEIARFSMIWVGLLGAAYATGKRRHLSIDLFVSDLKGGASSPTSCSWISACCCFPAAPWCGAA